MQNLPIKCPKHSFDTQNTIFCDEKCFWNMFQEFFVQKIFGPLPSEETGKKNRYKMKNVHFLTLKE